MRVSKEKNAEYQRKWFQANKELQTKRVRDKQRLMKLFIFYYKECRSCTDCGQWFPPCAMDFDHISDNKDGTIASMAIRGSWDKLIDEISKCELVCSNCHRIRTWLRSH